MHAHLATLSIDDPGDLDLFSALGTGLADQQISNDPGGERWTRLADDVVAMFIAHVGAQVAPPRTSTTMTTTTTTTVEDIPPITRTEAEVLARTEYARLVDQLRSLAPADWTRPTDCPLWDVRAMAGHSVGMLVDLTSLGSLVRRMRSAGNEARRPGGRWSTP